MLREVVVQKKVIAECGFCDTTVELSGPNAGIPAGWRWGQLFGCGMTGYTREILTCPACKTKADDYRAEHSSTIASTRVDADRVRWDGNTWLLSSLAPNKAGYWIYPRPGSSCTWVDKDALERENLEVTKAFNRYGEYLGTLAELNAPPLLPEKVAHQREASSIILNRLRASSSPLSIREISDTARANGSKLSSGAFRDALWELIERGVIHHTPEWKVALGPR